MYWLFMKTRKDLCSISSVTWQELVCGVKYRVRDWSSAVKQTRASENQKSLFEGESRSCGKPGGRFSAATPKYF